MIKPDMPNLFISNFLATNNDAFNKTSQSDPSENNLDHLNEDEVLLYYDFKC